MLRSTLSLTVARPAAILQHICDDFAEYGRIERREDRAEIALSYGRASMELREGGLAFVAEAEDDGSLAYMKLAVSRWLLEESGESPDIEWIGHGSAGTPLPYFREMQVVSTRALTPGMRRVTLRGEDLGRFTEGGLHVRLLFPPRDRRPVWPVTGRDGMPVWPEGEDRIVSRVYTIRRIDVAAGTVDIDIVLHPGEATPGSTFAETARAGDLVGMTGPGGGHIPEARRLILLGDETALPAIARILEALPDEAHAKVVLDVAGPQEEQALPSRARTEITWIHRGTAHAGHTTCLEEVLTALPADAFGEETFIWAACEFHAFRAIRRHLRRERKVPAARHLAVAYWRRGIAGDEARRDAQKSED